MRLATTGSAVLLALSTAALAQVTDRTQTTPGNNMMVSNSAGPGDATMPDATMAPPTAPADNMLDNSAAPPPREPR